MTDNAAAPGALLALWNDVKPAYDAEYERWHSIEHVPERVWVPGFLAGTRYVSHASDRPRYFTLYLLESLRCLETPSYVSLVEEPTAWSKAIRPLLQNFLRKPLTIVADCGLGVGAGLAVVRLVFGLEEQPSAEVLHAFARKRFVEGAGHFVTRVQIGATSVVGPQALPNQDSAPAGAEFILLAQTSRAACAEQLAHLLEEACRQAGAVWCQASAYQLASHVVHAEVSAPSRPAPPPPISRTSQAISLE